MDHALLPIIKRIIDDYGDDFFGNMARANAVLLDLAPNMARERILIRNFIELNGYKTLRGAGDNYRLVKNRLIKSLTDTFCVERAAALWVANLFACALGFEDAAAPITAWGAESESVTHPGARSSVAIGKSHTVAVSADGSVFSHGSNDHFQCDVGNWKDIVAVAAGDTHTVGLCENGRVLAAGSNANDQCDVGHLNGIASVYAFGNDTVCVRTDGSAVAAGKSRFDLSGFKLIKSIAKFPEGIFGIREDGRVMTAVAPGASPEDVSEETGWASRLTGVSQIISTFVNGSVVLKNDGRIYKMGMPDNYYAQWRDVISIVDLSDAFAILRADGTVRVLPFDRDMQRKSNKADEWRDIASIYGKYKRLLGLTRDGGLCAACTDLVWLLRNGSQDFVANWYPIKRPY